MERSSRKRTWEGFQLLWSLSGGKWRLWIRCETRISKQRVPLHHCQAESGKHAQSQNEDFFKLNLGSLSDVTATKLKSFQTSAPGEDLEFFGQIRRRTRVLSVYNVVKCSQWRWPSHICRISLYAYPTSDHAINQSGEIKGTSSYERRKA